MITDDIVDAFLAAYAKSNADVREALKAVEPYLYNQAIEEAAERADDHMIEYDGSTMGVGEAIMALRKEVTP